MSKKEGDRLVNAIIDLHQDLKGELAKMNLAIGELRLSVMNLDNRVKVQTERLDKHIEDNNQILRSHETRIVHLEDKTLGGSFVSEPGAVYKRKKRKK